MPLIVVISVASRFLCFKNENKFILLDGQTVRLINQYEEMGSLASSG